MKNSPTRPYKELQLNNEDKKVTCECSNWAGYGEDSWGKHHHINCPKLETEKHKYIFYYEEAENCWAPAPDKIDELIDLSVGDECEIEFRCVEFTDKEIAELPEG